MSALAAVTMACGANPQLETRTFQLNHISPREASAIIEPYVFGDRPEAPGRLSNAAASVTVRETRDNLDRIARVLAQFDLPQPAVRLTFKLIEADGAAARDTSIADIETALRRLFQFRGYRLMTEAVVMGVQGTNATQTLSAPGAQYQLETKVLRLVGSGDSATVAMRVLLTASSTSRPGYAKFETEVRLPMRKTAVLGSARADTRQPTLILAVKPELVVN
jgi:hypothetical protein